MGAMAVTALFNIPIFGFIWNILKVSELVSGYTCNFDRSPVKDGMMWQVTQTPSFLDKNWPINWSWAWLMTPGYFGRCCLQNQLRICIRYKFLDQSPATGIIHASCASSRLCEAESSYPYANIIQIMINTQLARRNSSEASMCWVYFTHYLLRIM